MDEEWEILPHDGFLDYYGDGEKRGFLGGKRNNSNPKIVFNTNYFVCPSSPPKNSKVSPNQLVSVPFQLEPDPDAEIPKEVTKVPIEVCLLPPLIIPKVKGPEFGPKLEADQDSVSQVFFKKMKENEFVDMKLDSPTKSYPSKGFVPPPQIDAGSFGFEEKSETLEAKVGSPRISSPRMKNEKESVKEEVAWEEEEENIGGLNLWKWSLTGVGAICSFGVAAAATIFIIIMGSHQKNSNQQVHNQNLRFQIYTDDKRIKQVVHHASKLNEAISSVREVPINRAHITYGGYYDGI